MSFVSYFQGNYILNFPSGEKVSFIPIKFDQDITDQLNTYIETIITDIKYILIAEVSENFNEEYKNRFKKLVQTQDKLENLIQQKKKLKQRFTEEEIQLINDYNSHIQELNDIRYLFSK
jgi:cell shape-determining protein MreC